MKISSESQGKRTRRQARRAAVEALQSFVKQAPRRVPRRLTALSLFSGGGVGDLGYAASGFSFKVHAEIDKRRAAVCARNFPKSAIVVGDLRKCWHEVVRRYQVTSTRPLDLLVVTPPCQGMSSSNPSRGKVTDADSGNRRAKERNLLILPVAKIIRQLQPRIVVIENVPQFLARLVRVKRNSEPVNVVRLFMRRIRGYASYRTVVQMADFGIPQARRRSVIVLVRKDDKCFEFLRKRRVLPWPRATYSEDSREGKHKWLTVSEWLRAMRYPPLDASNQEKAQHPSTPLHRVPAYGQTRYSWIAHIPPNSGANAYQNSTCLDCHSNSIAVNRAHCHHCGAPMRHRPHVKRRNGRIRLIRGFQSSYRRMRPDRPAPTITTASSHLGSDYTIHPWENRVLSALECADLQTVPRTYDWSAALDNGLNYMVRKIVGEAMPPWFTYLHGQVLASIVRRRTTEAAARAN